jgi:hypothetical protein
MTKDVFDDIFGKHFGSDSSSGPPVKTNFALGSCNHFKYLSKSMRWHYKQRDTFPDKSGGYKNHSKILEKHHTEMHETFTKNLHIDDYIRAHGTVHRDDSDNDLEDFYYKKVMRNMPMTGRP